MRKALPVHPNGLTAIGFRRNGAPIWPVLGGAEPDPAPDPANPPTDQDDEPDEPDDDKPLGPAGEKALAAVKDKNKTLRATLRERDDELVKLRSKVAAGDDAEKAARDAEALRHESEVNAKANARIVRAEMRAAAAGKLADPGDAIKFIDPEQFEVDEDGDVDQDEIAKAVADLVKKKPYLAAQGGTKTPKPDRRQGGGSDDVAGSMAAGRAAYQARTRKN